MNFILRASLLALATTSVNYNNTTEIANYYIMEKENVIDLLYKINEGYKIVYDYCENLELNDGYIFKNDKPDCLFNYSYIDSNNGINLYTIKKDIRTMFKDYKNTVCKTKDIECGEFTIVLKMIDIINSAITIIVEDVNNPNIWNNLRVIDFYPQIEFLKYAVNNVDFLTNITLKKDKINMLLTIEKNKLSDNMNRIGVEKYLNYAYNYIGTPIKRVGSYISSFIGETLGGTIDKIIPELKLDTKIIIIIILIILLKKL